LHPRKPFASLLDELNDVQREGVLHGDGPLLILAGAGSGKTRVLTHRLAYLVAERDVPADRILAVTFTNKAANEMKERVARLLGEDAGGVWMGTFHSICLRILKRHQQRLGFRGTLTVFDSEDQLALLRGILKEIGNSEAGVKARSVQIAISMAKNMLLDPDRYEEGAKTPARTRIARVWRLYQERLRAQDGADFDDLLLLTLELLQKEKELGERYARRFRHLLVDEYQDTNRVQFHLLQLLAHVHGNVCVVGDDDQSIYRWRGADITNILEFERHFHGARVLRLEQNYRSTKSILDVANAVIQFNVSRKEKTLWTENESGERPRLHLGEGEEEEARYVARRIKRLCRSGESPSDFAVLYRTHAQSRALEEALLRSETAYRVIGGVSFYERREVKDLLAYLRLLVNRYDEISFRRAALAPRRGAGETSLDRLVEAARERQLDLLTACREARDWSLSVRGLPALQQMAEILEEMRERCAEPPHRLIASIADRIDYRDWLKAQHGPDWEERWAHVVELIEGAKSYEASEEETGLTGYLEQVALYAQTDSLTPGEERVVLMTAHNAKGLEFGNVYVTGLEEGLFPHVSSLTDPEELEEERRLFYVAVTRARRRLTLTASRARRRINYSGSSELSRFLLEIPSTLFDAENLPSHFPAGRLSERERLAESAARGDGDFEEVTITREAAEAPARGLRAKHVRYGIGEVLSIEGEGDRARVEVRFPLWGVKRIVRSYLDLLEEE
jgi:DNA helicase-2/ATP-dependent DNA helicase PcrA